MKYSNDELLKMYKNMVLSRVYENVGIKYLQKGVFKYGTWHLALGEEATQTGSISALQKSDFYALPIAATAHWPKRWISKNSLRRVSVKPLAINGERPLRYTSAIWMKGYLM